MQYYVVEYNTIQYSTVKYSTVQYNTIHYSTVQYRYIIYITSLGILVPFPVPFPLPLPPSRFLPPSSSFLPDCTAPITCSLKKWKYIVQNFCTQRTKHNVIYSTVQSTALYSTAPFYRTVLCTVL